jgi:hypothetical protein
MPSRVALAAALVAAALGTLPHGALAGTATASAAAPSAVAKTADDVLTRNAAARGGFEAWRKVDRMVWLGHIEPALERDDTPNPKFVMHLQRPNQVRFEIKTKHSDYTRIFDGTHGWSTHPAKDGRPTVTSFSKADTDFAKGEFVIDGPLLDAKAKGVKASLDGIDTVDGQKAYRLSLKLPGGAERKVWVDLKTNLEVRYDRPAGSGADPNRPVQTYYRDWREEEGVWLPHTIETSAAPADSSVELPRGDRVVIERVLVNPTLDADTFAMPAAPMRRNKKTEVHIDNGAPGITELSR